MPRPKPDLSITLENHRTGERHRITLHRLAAVRRYQVRYDDAPSDKVSTASISEVCRRVRKLLVKMAA